MQPKLGHLSWKKDYTYVKMSIFMKEALEDYTLWVHLVLQNKKLVRKFSNFLFK